MINNNLITLYNYCQCVFHDDINDPYDKIQKLSRKRFREILELCESILSINETSTFNRSRKVLLRPMIEAAIDIQNLKTNDEDYVNTLELFSLQEANQFFNKYFKYYKKFICNNNKFDKYSKLAKVKKLKKSIYDNMGYETKVIISDKFCNLENRERFQRYELAYDVLSLYIHNTDLKVLKFLKHIDDNFYWDIVSSILKNSLINLSKSIISK